MRDEFLNWIQDKPRIPTILAFMQALATKDSSLDLINNLEKLVPGDNVGRYHSTNHWLKLYKNPSLVITGALEHVAEYILGNKPLGQLIVVLIRSASEEFRRLPDFDPMGVLTSDPTISDENAQKIIEQELA